MTVMYETLTKKFIESNGNKLEVPVGKTVAKFDDQWGYIDGYVQYDHHVYAMFVSTHTVKIRPVDLDFIRVLDEPNEIT